ncbi:hypothetical protein EGR_00904 [Echinococcus granulosus]|uniref:Uncharacterized protein n=1 Tax=Echinococcus granulosus TaxID=6210 RepID=W6URK0_ECHGR|nr:hypothetical protein EGR_00904 [Echinococcus granulosus]EUB64360.1 hypothetical protein EGR_00904 [Echinococcus granulosus]
MKGTYFVYRDSITELCVLSVAVDFTQRFWLWACEQHLCITFGFAIVICRLGSILPPFVPQIDMFDFFVVVTNVISHFRLLNLTIENSTIPPIKSQLRTILDLRGYPMCINTVLDFVNQMNRDLKILCILSHRFANYQTFNTNKLVINHRTDWTVEVAKTNSVLWVDKAMVCSGLEEFGEGEIAPEKSHLIKAEISADRSCFGKKYVTEPFDDNNSSHYKLEVKNNAIPFKTQTFGTVSTNRIIHVTSPARKVGIPIIYLNQCISLQRKYVLKSTNRTEIKSKFRREVDLKRQLNYSSGIKDPRVLQIQAIKIKEEFRSQSPVINCLDETGTTKTKQMGKTMRLP